MTFGQDFPDNDPVAARLRAALNAEADMVQPSGNSLQTIRERIGDESSPRWRTRLTAAAAAAVVVLLGIGAGALLFGGGNDREVIAGAGTSTTPTESSSASPSDPAISPSPTPPEPGRGSGVAWVYYLADDPDAGIRLYREQRGNSTTLDAEVVSYAVQQMLSVPPADPDYSSPWPTGTQILNLKVEGDTAVVDLSSFVRTGSEAEQAAVQQLVYTVTANDPEVRAVRLLVNGEVPRSGSQDWSQPVGRAPQVDTLGLIWLLQPGEGATVESPVKITGYGTAFEGTVSWVVEAADGSDVAEGFTQAGANGEFAEFSDTVELPPGEYTLLAFESSAEDGRPIHMDTKSFTVAE